MIGVTGILAGAVVLAAVFVAGFVAGVAASLPRPPEVIDVSGRRAD